MGKFYAAMSGILLLVCFGCAQQKASLGVCPQVSIKIIPVQKVSQIQLQKDKEVYLKKIHLAVKKHWRTPGPKQIDPGHDICRVRVIQTPTGCIKRFTYMQCASPILQKTIRQAIINASPLPRAKYRALYDNELILVFMPRRW